MFGLEPNTIALGVVGVINLATAVLAALTYSQSRKTELNTNSMKDALVKAVATSARMEGRDEMRAEAEKTAKDLLKDDKKNG